MTTPQPQRNGQLRQLRREKVTRYMTGAMGRGFNIEALGEDMAAKFLEHDDGQIQKYVFEHWVLTYTEREMAERMAALKQTAEKIRSYGIDVNEIENEFRSYELHLLKRKDDTREEKIVS